MTPLRPKSGRRLHPLLALPLALAGLGLGCAAPQAPLGLVTAHGRLAVQDRGGRRILSGDAGPWRGHPLAADVNPWVAADLDHVVLTIATQADPTTPLHTITVPRASLATTGVAFTNLDRGTPYRIVASAYHLPVDGGGNEVAGSEVDAGGLPCTTDFATTELADQELGGIRLLLADKTFAGEADATGLHLTEGQLLHAGASGGAYARRVSVFSGGTDASLSPFGYANGPAAATEYQYPTGVATDARGDVYVADLFSDVVRKIDRATGIASAIAGGTDVTANGSGYANGAGSAARFGTIVDVAVDGDGNVYVADQGSGTVRKLAPSAGSPPTYAASTIAGGTDAAANGAGYANGAGSAAQFNTLQGIAVDGAGKVYVTDVDGAGAACVRVLTPSGGPSPTYAVSTLAGGTPSAPNASGYQDGAAAQAQFRNPGRLAATAAGDLYVADTDNHSVRRIDHATGQVSLVAGGQGPSASGFLDGAGAAARLDSPTGVALDEAGLLYVADASNFAIRRIDPATGAVQTIAGAAGGVRNGSGFGNGTGAAVHFGAATGLASGPGGYLYVTERDAHDVRLVR